MTFHSIHTNGLRVLPDPPKPLAIPAAHVFESSRPVPPTLKGLSAAPFLVPAVIEALKSSRCYAPIVQMVPAEADIYCAAAARENGGVVLTSDSDMLVHDIGPNGAVAFFDQFELQRSGAGSTSVHVMICRPGEISKRLALDDLQRLAFEIKKDPSSSFQEALRRARGYKPMGITDIHYKKFLEEYASETLDDGPLRESMPANPLINTSEQWLDPRVSELVLQFAAQKEPQVKMYLPFLIDDPTRSPAWGVSSSLRCFAYSLLLFLTNEASKVRSVAEYGRRGLRIASHEVQLLTKQQCLTYVEGLKDRFSQLRGGLESTTLLCFFKAYAIYLICQWHVDNDKPRPTRGTLSGLLTGAAGRTFTWIEIHLLAQLQAALYSLRMLKQILRYVKAVVVADIPPLLGDLDMILEELEPIDKLIPTRMEVFEQGSSSLETGGLLDSVFGLLGDEGAEVDANNAQSRSSTKPVPSDFTEVPITKRRRKGRVAESKAVPPVSNEPTNKHNNIYRLLAES